MRKLLLQVLLISGFAFPAFADYQNQQYVNQYKYISTASTTVVKAGPAVLHTISVHGGVPGTISVYNDGSAATAANLAFVIDSTSGPTTYAYDIDLTSGCTVRTAAATNVVVAFK